MRMIHRRRIELHRYTSTTLTFCIERSRIGKASVRSIYEPVCFSTGRSRTIHRCGAGGADRVVDGGVDLRLLGDDQSAGDPDNPAIGGVLAVPRLARGFRAIAAIVKQARHETDQVLCSLEAS